MRWWRFVRLLLAVTLIGAGGLVLLLLLIDPYGTGRFTIIASPRIPPLIERYAAPSLARNPAFDSAIFGNSTAELLSPARLDEALGGRFVQLFVKGTGPAEQLVVMEWFRRHHPAGVRFLVIDIDTYWCSTRANPLAPPTPDFPYWLYNGSLADYVEGLVSFRALRSAGRRALLFAGRGKAMREDGFVDYEAGRSYDAAAALARLHGQAAEYAAIDRRVPSDTPVPAMPGFARLAEELARFPATTRKFLVMMPLHGSLLPPPGSFRARELAACKTAAAAVAAAVPATRLLDRWRDGPETPVDNLWWDGAHYRGAVARLIEDMIAEADRSWPTAP